MEKNCLKCGATSQVEDTPAAACPKCGAIYAKVEAQRSFRQRPASGGGQGILWGLGLLLAVGAYMGYSRYEDVKQKREKVKLQAEIDAHMNHLRNRDIATVFPAGRVFENRELEREMRVMEAYGFQKDQTFRLKQAGVVYVVQTEKVDDGTIPPRYRIVSANIEALHVPRTDVLCFERRRQLDKEGLHYKDVDARVMAEKNSGLCK